MTRSAGQPDDTARMAYCTFWDWKDDPPYDEISSRINSLLQRGAKEIHLYDADPGSGDTHEVVIAARKLSPRERLAVWSFFSEDDSAWPADGSGYDWKKDPEPRRS